MSIKRHHIAIGLLAGLSLTFGLTAFFDSPAQAQEKPSAGKAQAKSPAGSKVSELTPLQLERKVVDQLDSMMEAKWKERDLKPSDKTTNHAWLRRAAIDLLGRSPTPKEFDSYMLMLGERDDAWRSKVVERMLESDEYARWWGLQWQKALISNGGMNRNRGTPQLRNWLIEQVKANRPYDEWVREMIATTAEVNLQDAENASPAGYFTSFENDLNNLTGNLSRAFMGIEIQCVQCHDDKLGEPWNQPDFRGMAAIFRGTRVSRKVNDRASDYYETYKITDNRVTSLNARQRERLEKQAMEDPNVADRLALLLADPKPLGEDELEVDNGLELRSTFAEWLTSKDNPWFARTAVNRVWGRLMKRGIVDPVDDFNSINEPSNPELLEFLSKDFQDNGYDLQRLTRIIMSTRAYQLSSETNKSNKDDLLYFSRGLTRQLDALELLGSLFAATNVSRTIENADERNADRIKRAVAGQFTQTFEDDEGAEQETFTGTIPQALLMMNGDFVSTAASALPGGTLFDILRKQKTIEARVERMYIAALGRPPERSETKTMTRYIEGEKGVVSAYEDVFWALLNSAEFLNNH